MLNQPIRMYAVPSPTAQIVLFDGFDPLDVIAPFEVLAAGSDAMGGELAVELVSATGPGVVRSGTRGLELSAMSVLDPERPGYVIVPGASGPAVAGAVEDLFGHERRGTVWQDRGRTPVVGKRVVA